jgi:hypothetical protein
MQIENQLPRHQQRLGIIALHAQGELTKENAAEGANLPNPAGGVCVSAAKRIRVPTLALHRESSARDRTCERFCLREDEALAAGRELLKPTEEPRQRRRP